MQLSKYTIYNLKNFSRVGIILVPLTTTLNPAQDSKYCQSLDVLSSKINMYK